MIRRPPRPPLDGEKLIETWRAAWPQALDAWSRYTRLKDPLLCVGTVEAAREGLSGSFAMIRLLDQSVVIDLEAVHGYRLEAYAVEILAHEIGHHVLAPATVRDHFRLIARMRRALPSVEEHAAMVANLYTDLRINDRLQRQAGLRMADIYRLLAPRPGAGKDAPKQSPLWTLYMRIYEHLWQIERGQLAGADVDDVLDTDAWLGARLIRVYGADWMTGGGRFATLLLPYLLKKKVARPVARQLRAWHDTGDAAGGCVPDGLSSLDDEEDDAPHPVHDPLITGDAVGAPQEQERNEPSRGQLREPFEYGELLRAGGIKLGEQDIAMRYYRERALPYLVPFPTRPVPRVPEPEPEGLEPWAMGDPLDQIDWLQSVTISPFVVPGVTTVRRTHDAPPLVDHIVLPVDLDLYVDSSGSMPNPQHANSYMALAGAIVALSALRVGASVQVTLWSGKREVMGTTGFVRDEQQILRVLTGYLGGGTCFPIHRLRDTYAARPRQARLVHILMISDDGITTMFDQDERGASGWDIAAHALAAAGGGGTMALNLHPDWRTWGGSMEMLRRAGTEQGWGVHQVTDLEQLLAFARAFSLQKYGSPPGGGAGAGAGAGRARR